MNRSRIFVVAVVAAIVLTGGLIWVLDDLYPGALQDDDNWQSFTYKLLLLVLLGSSLIVRLQRERPSYIMWSLLVWLAIGSAAVLTYSFRDEFGYVWNRVATNLSPGTPVSSRPGTATLTRRRDGHFHVVAEVNGQRVEFLVDTGASDVALTLSDARRIGIDVQRLVYNIPYQTANGTTLGARIRLDQIKIGDIVVRDVPGHVAESIRHTQSLLGMTFLRRLVSFEFRGDELILKQ